MSDHATGSKPRAPAPPTVRVRLPAPLRPLVGGSAELEAEGATVGALVEELVRRYPSLERHLRTGSGVPREHVNLFLDRDDVRYLDGLDTPVSAGQELVIIASIAGG